MDEDKLLRAIARLRALKTNLPMERILDLAYVDEFRGALKHLEDVGLDVSEFRLSQEHFTRIPVRTEPVTKTTVYKDCVERGLLLSRIDAALGYFELLMPNREQPRSQMGFRPPGEDKK